MSRQKLFLLRFDQYQQSTLATNYIYTIPRRSSSSTTNNYSNNVKHRVSLQRKDKEITMRLRSGVVIFKMVGQWDNVKVVSVEPFLIGEY